MSKPTSGESDTDSLAQRQTTEVPLLQEKVSSTEQTDAEEVMKLASVKQENIVVSNIAVSFETVKEKVTEQRISEGTFKQQTTSQIDQIDSKTAPETKVERVTEEVVVSEKVSQKKEEPKEAPKIVTSLKDISVLEKQKLTFEVAFTAQPAPQVSS